MIENQDPNQNVPEEDLSGSAIFEAFLQGEKEGKSFIDWAKANPTYEYRLWLMTRDDSEDLEKLARQRLERSRRAPRVTKVGIVLGGLITSAHVAGTGYTLVESKSPAALLFAWGAWFFGNLTKRMAKEQLPEDYKYAEHEQYNFDQVFGSTPHAMIREAEAEE